jgi:hypothetical protein
VTLLHALRVATVLLECLLEGVQHALVRDDDAQFAVPVERLGGDVLRAYKGFLAIDELQKNLDKSGQREYSSDG